MGINIGNLLAVFNIQTVFTPALQTVLSNLGQVNSAVTAAQQNLGKFTNITQQSANELINLGRGLREAGTVATGLFTAPLLAAGKAVIDFGGGFEREMTKVVTLASGSTEFIDKIRESTLALAPAVGVGPQELAKGLFVVESYGFEAAKSMEILEIAAKMSALGMGDMSQTTLGLTGAIFAYKNQNLDAAEAANIFIKAVRLGNMEISELIPAMATVNPMASALGIKMEAVAAALATFTHAGVNARIASTGLRAMLGNILTDSVKTGKGFRDLAAVTEDSTITMENFRKSIAEDGLTKAMTDLSEKAESAGIKGVEALNKIFPNIRALTQALAVYYLNGEKVTEINNEMANGVDVLSESMAYVQQTWDHQWKQMTVAVEVLWVRLSEGLLPIIKEFLAVFQGSVLPILQDAIFKFNNLSETSQKAFIWIAAFFAGLGPGIIILGTLIVAVGNLAKGLALLAGAQAMAGPAAVVAFVKNPWIVGGAIALGLLAAAYMSLTSKISVNTEATFRAIDPQMKTIASLEEMKKKVNDVNLKMSEKVKISRDLIALNPTLISDLDAQNLALKDLKKAVEDVTEAQKDSLRIKHEVLLLQKGELESAILAEQQTMKRARNILESPFTRQTEKDVLRSTFIEAEEAMVGYQRQLDNVIEREKIIREVVDDNYRASQQNNRLWNQMAADQEANHLKAMRQTADGRRQVLLLVEALDDLDKTRIRELKSQGLNYSQIADETKIELDIISVYLRQMEALEGQEKRTAAAIDARLAATETANSRAAQIWAEYEQTMASIRGDSIAVREADIEKWLAREEAALRKLADLGADVSDGMLATQMTYDAKQAELNVKRADLEASIASDMAQMWDEYYRQIAIGNEDSLEAKLAAADKWYSEQYAIIEKAAEKEKQHWSKLGLVVEAYHAKKAAIIRATAAAQEKALNELAITNQRVADDTEAIWERHDAVISKMQGDTMESRISAVRVQMAKMVAANEEAQARVIADIRNSKIIADHLKEEEVLKAIQAHKEKNDAILALEKALIEEIKKAKKEADFSAIIDGIISIGNAVGGTTGFIINNLAGLAQALRDFQAGSLSTAQKIGSVLQGAADVWTATSGDSNQVLSGAISGAKAGAVFGMWGAVIGTAAGAIVGFVRSLHDGRKAIEEFANASGGFDKLHERLSTLGEAGEEFWISLTQGTAKGNGESAKRKIEEIKKALEDLEESIQKYSLTWTNFDSLENRMQGSARAAYNLKAEYDRLIAAGYQHGVVLERMTPDINTWINESIRAGVQIPAAMQPIIQKLIETGGLTAENARLMLGLAEDSVPSLKEIEEAAGRYGLKLDELGPKVQQLRFTETADQIVADFDKLVRAGVPFETLMADLAKADTGEATEEVRSMREQIQKLVDDSLTLGYEFPENMRPILQKMVDAGLLTDEFGVKLDTLEGLKFNVPLEDQIGLLIEALDRLIDKIGGPGGVSEAFNSIKVPDVDTDGIRGGGWRSGVIPQADGGDWLVTKPTLFLAGEAGAERATFTPIGRGGGSSGINLQINVYPTPGMSEEEIAERAARKVPQILREHGF